MGLALILSAWAGLAFAATDSRILFPGTTSVPRAAQEFAWRVIETRCNYQSYEREQRTFWAYQTKATRSGAGTAYSIGIVSEVPWRKALPPNLIEMTIVDDGGLRLAALKSSFVVCAPAEGRPGGLTKQ
jgi:hypothetical protein